MKLWNYETLRLWRCIGFFDFDFGFGSLKLRSIQTEYSGCSIGPVSIVAPIDENHGFSMRSGVWEVPKAGNFSCNQWCMSRGRSLASRQPRGSKSAASALPRLVDASPQSCLALNVTSKLRYDIIIHNFHSFIFFISAFKTFKTKLHLMYVHKTAFLDAS